MGITLELPEGLTEILSAEATQCGLPLEDYLVSILSTNRPAPTPPRNGRELVAFWEKEGLIGTNPDIVDSQQLARAIREED